MEWLGALKERYAAWEDAYVEAVRRDRAAAEELRKEGWSDDSGGWTRPAENDMIPNGMFDGPGSHVSLFGHLQDVAKERDLLGDVEAVRDLLHPRRKRP